jgi:hypothetical protein
MALTLFEQQLKNIDVYLSWLWQWDLVGSRGSFMHPELCLPAKKRMAGAYR